MQEGYLAHTLNFSVGQLALERSLYIKKLNVTTSFSFTELEDIKDIKDIKDIDASELEMT